MCMTAKRDEREKREEREEEERRVTATREMTANMMMTTMTGAMMSEREIPSSKSSDYSKKLI